MDITLGRILSWMFERGSGPAAGGLDPSALNPRLFENPGGRSFRLDQRHGINFGLVGDLNRKDRARFRGTTSQDKP